MDKYPITGRSLEIFYGVDGDRTERQYKNHLSGYRQWCESTEGKHADKWRIWPKNMGPFLSIDETALSRGELYTIVSNKAAHGRENSIVAMIEGTDSEEVIKALRQIDSVSRNQVKEITLDLSESMNRICRYAFPHAQRVIDRFHLQRLALDAVQEIRIAHRWDAIQAETDAKENAKLLGERYVAEKLSNGDTLKELLARSRYVLFKSPEKWTEKQKARAKLIFSLYPDLSDAYWLAQHLRTIFNKVSTKEAARLNLARWYDKVDNAGFKSFQTIAATIYEHHDEILNFFNKRSTNAQAESLNSKIKEFRARLHGVNDKKFFLYRIGLILG